MIPALFLVLGCAGVLDLSRATPLAPGEMRFQAGTAAGAWELSAVYPGVRFAAGVHAGVSPGLEVGGGVGAVVLPGSVPLFEPDGCLEAKVRLGKESESRWHAALNPRFRMAYGNAIWWPAILEVPLLLGLDVGSGQVVLAPRAGLVIESAEAPRFTPQLGASLGWALPLSEDLEILPGVGIDWSVRYEDAAASAGLITVAAGMNFVVAIE